MGNWAFSIWDVSNLLNLNIRRKSVTNADVDCPFCNYKKGKMNINFQKNAFRCNYCGESGGMIALYAKVYGLNNSDAYVEICESLRIGTNPKTSVYQKNIVDCKSNESTIANLETRHQTYAFLFSMLTLSKTHEFKLLERGLTEIQIRQNGYKSTPAYGFTKLAAALKENGCVVNGVPGFYIDDNDEWTINFSSKCSGIIIPVMGIDGKINGAQIRIDRPFNDMKYMWFTSNDKKGGVSAGSPVHFVGDPADKVVYITEGPLKATIAHCLSGKTFIGIPGANQHRNLNSLLEVLKNNGTEEIVEAFDMDKYENEHVQKGCNKLYSIASKLGFKLHSIRWNEKYKGVDDYLYSSKIKEK